VRWFERREVLLDRLRGFGPHLSAQHGAVGRIVVLEIATPRAPVLVLAALTPELTFTTAARDAHHGHGSVADRARRATRLGGTLPL